MHRNITLLITSLKISSDLLGVSTSPGYTMRLPEIVILVRLRSNFFGRNSHRTLLKHIYFLYLTGMFSCLMTKTVSEPANNCFLSLSFHLPTPCHRCPRLFVYDYFHTCLILGWLRSWLHSRIFPNSSSKTGMAQFSINSYG